MIDASLTEEVRIALTKAPSVRKLSDEEAGAAVDAVAKRWEIDTDANWWWEGLSAEHHAIPYDDDGLDKLAQIAPTDARAHLVITDDELPPWPVLTGTVGDLIGVLRELPFCEFFLVDPKHEWIVFDTHESQLVVAGTPPVGAALQ